MSQKYQDFISFVMVHNILLQLNCTKRAIKLSGDEKYINMGNLGREGREGIQVCLDTTANSSGNFYCNYFPRKEMAVSFPGWVCSCLLEKRSPVHA